MDEARPATLNMAIDEWLLQAQHAVDATPTFRFYSWDRPSVSVGYFQKIEVAAQKFNAEKKNLPVVRRLSGGGSVEHGKDLTFSLTLKTQNPFFPTDVKTSYLRINEAIRTGLKMLYSKLDYADCRTAGANRKRQSDERVCFEAPACYDLLLDGQKVLGASQRRVGNGLLHQSSLFLNGDRQYLTKAILRGFESLWGVKFEQNPLSEQELDAARELEQARYISKEWANPVAIAGMAVLS